ncbi:MAG: hypothetical protein M3040_00915 [Bacteroidota bacterium]|nr:hypothetical protein [Bacteroidota bacterium]
MASITLKVFVNLNYKKYLSNWKIRLLVIMFFTSGYSVVAQNNFSLDCKELYNSFIIKPSWANLKLLTFTDSVSFNGFMSQFGYSHFKNNSLYKSNTRVGDPSFYIERETNGLSMISVEPGFFLSALKFDLKKMLKGEAISVQDGYEVYKFNYRIKDCNYDIKIFLKEDDEGAVVDLNYVRQ